MPKLQQPADQGPDAARKLGRGNDPTAFRTGVSRKGKSETAGRREVSSHQYAEDRRTPAQTEIPGGVPAISRLQPTTHERRPAVAQPKKRGDYPHDRAPLPRKGNSPRPRASATPGEQGNRFSTPDQFLNDSQYTGAQAARGAGRQPLGGPGHGGRFEDPAVQGVINNIISSYLLSRGQIPGRPPSANSDPSEVALAQLREGKPDLGPLHEPGIMGNQQLISQIIQGAGRAGGQGAPPGAGMVMPGGKVPFGAEQAAQNPLAPFLGQMLNPRMSPSSPMGSVPTLPGAPQGFSLYNMLRLLGMFKQLYGMLPTPTQGAYGLPTGIPGPGY